MKNTRRAALPVNHWWMSPLVVYAALASLQVTLQWLSQQPIQIPHFPFT